MTGTALAGRRPAPRVLRASRSRSSRRNRPYVRDRPARPGLRLRRGASDDRRGRRDRRGARHRPAGPGRHARRRRVRAARRRPCAERRLECVVLNAKNDAEGGRRSSPRPARSARSPSPPRWPAAAPTSASAAATRRTATRVDELGGLYVIGTGRHDSRRIDDQLRGRAGRQGDPGESMFFVSLEDELIKRYGPSRCRRARPTPTAHRRRARPLGDRATRSASPRASTWRSTATPGATTTCSTSTASCTRAPRGDPRDRRGRRAARRAGAPDR